MAPMQWQTIDIPIGKGIDTKTEDLISENGQLSESINNVFTKGGTLKRRNGHVALGAPTNGRALANYDSELLVQDGSSLKTLDSSSGALISRGSLRSVPVQAVTLAQSAYDLTLPDSTSNGMYTLHAWLNSNDGLVHAEVIHEATGAVVISDTAISSSSAIRLQCVAAWGLLWVVYQLSSGSLRVLPYTPGGTFGAEVTPGFTLQANSWFRAYGSSSEFAIACVTASAGGSLSVLKLTNTGANLTNALLAGSFGNSAVMGLTKANGSYWVIALNGTILTSYQVDPTALTLTHSVGLVTVVTPGHVTVAAYSGTEVAIFWDVYGGDSSQRYIQMCRVNTSGFFTLTPVVWLRSVSIASDAFVQDGEIHLLVKHYSLTSITNKASGATVTTVNSLYLLYSMSGNIIAQALKYQAADPNGIANTPSVCVVSSGRYRFAASVLGSFDLAGTSRSVAYAGVASIKVDFSSERMRSAQLNRSLIISGGMPSYYDGTSVVEDGIALAPEIKSTKALFQWGEPLTIWTPSTAYKVGDVVVPPTASLNGFCYVCSVAGTSGGASPTWSTVAGTPITDGTVTWLLSCTVGGGTAWTSTTAYALGAVVGNTAQTLTFVCTTAGTSGGSAPTWPTTIGATVNDGSVVWTCQSNINGGTSFMFTYGGFGVAGSSRNIGFNVVPTQPNGYWYVLLQNSYTLPTQEPTWPTQSGAIIYDSAGKPLWKCIGRLGRLGNGARGYQVVYEWTDAKGKLHQSMPSAAVSVTVPHPNSTDANAVQLTISTLRLTKKQNVRIAVYTTMMNGSTLQKVNYVANDPTVDTVTFIDTAADSYVAMGPIIYTASEIPNELAPSLSSLAVRGSRLYGVGGEDPYSVFASKLESATLGTPIGWSSFLKIAADPAGGALTAVATMDEKTIVFQQARVGYFVGDGPDNTGSNGTWSSIQPISADVGCTNPDSIVLTPMGLMFQSAKGIYLLSRDMQVVEIGRQVTAYASTIWSKVLVNPNATEVRFLAPGGNSLVFDWTYGQWGRFAGVSGPDATVWNGSITLLSGAIAIWQESSSATDDAGTTADRIITFVPIKAAGIQGYQRARSFELLFQVNPANFGAAQIVIDVAANGDSQWVTYYAGPLGALPYSVNNLQRVSVGLRPDHAKCESLQIRVSEISGGGGAVIGEVIALSVTVGIKGGAFRLPATNKVG